MKDLTTREFLQHPGIVKALRPGQSLLVTENGKPEFVVTKVGQRPRRSRAELEHQAREISAREKPKVNFTTALRDLKG